MKTRTPWFTGWTLIAALLGGTVMSCEVDLTQDSKLFVKNRSTSYLITEVRYGVTSLGNNRLDEPIRPGKTRSWTLESDGPHAYEVEIVSTMPGAEGTKYVDGLSMYNERVVYYTLTDDGWDMDWTD
ncbi:MAG TPA: hypothetical protein PK313_03925 [Myxococcota bacterium]|nr:hypothetical protein [Myxococcota bacterium]